MSFPLTDSQAQALLTDKRNKAKPVAKKILAYLNASTAFMLNNGDVIYQQQGYYCMSFNEVFALAQQRESVFTATHSCAYFLANHTRLLERFQAYFDGNYDFTVGSLKTIDRAYSRLIKAGVSEADLFLPVVCYVAEVIIRRTQGQWSQDASNPSVAVVTGSDGQVYDPYFSIRKIMINHHRPHAFESIITLQLP